MTARALLIALTFAAVPVWADYGVLDSGEMVKPGQYKFTGDMQILTENSGVNLGGRGEMALSEDKGLRAQASFGKLDFTFGGFFKWMPMRDTETQPNLGGNMGILYVKDGDVSDLIIRVEPLVSKSVRIEDTVFTPYASFPVGMRIRKSDDPAINEDTEVPIQLVVGTQLKIPQFDQLQFIGEIGIDLNKSPGYIALGALYYWDPSGEPIGNSKPSSSDDDE